ncbi:hypothetical protein LVJ82_16675 [Vitreoscilla massiliensis]|uniref:Uncharacterized protein n=1 Tax=Vitreoscilla massiliensis TaxID=1689272 RepID=A0ABY4E1D5_9NEIS|nr:hypothetical protein [Vitreoscilla massiliensis]UOO89059.1 hypothetical protein LVJ82_16675 [Vitreoscilla massiliensis]
MKDTIDVCAGITEASALYQTRRFRPEFVDGAVQCEASVLRPVNDLGLSAELRLAIALRIAKHNGVASLIAEYKQRFAEVAATPALQALAHGQEMGAEWEALARHIDMVTQEPSLANAEHIALLRQAGYSDSQIVALSELIAFVNFQTRVVSGLQLLGA